MEIQYELTQGDFWAFFQHANRNSTGIVDVIGWLLPYALVFATGIALGWEWQSALTLCLILGPIWLVVVASANRRRVTDRWSDSNDGVGPQTLRITPEGLFATAPNMEQHVSWAGVRKIVHAYDYLFIYLGRGHAFVVPKRAFPSLAEAKAFADQAQAYLSDATTPS